MHKFVTLGLIQTKVSSNVNANIEKTTKFIRQAKKQGAQIICLQELFDIPYIPQKQGVKKDNYAETFQGPAITAMKKLAKELSVIIIVPFYEKENDGKYYNTAVVFDEQGKNLGKYRKVHIPQDPGFYEKDYFEHGQESYKIYKTKFATFAVLICYDQWFPEAARATRLNGAEIIFYPTAIGNIIGYAPEGDWHEAWETIQRSHAIANSVVVAAVNRVGIEGRAKFWGQSFISDPFGKVLKRGSQDKEQVVITKVDLERNKFFADGWGFLRNRRPDTYKILVTDKLVDKSKNLKNVPHYMAEKKALGEK